MPFIVFMFRHVLMVLLYEKARKLMHLIHAFKAFIAHNNLTQIL